MLDELANLEPFQIGDVTIHFEGFPSMTDGKTKKIWSEGKGYSSCYGCGATYKELAKEWHPKFANLKPEARSLALANCHLKICCFKWLVKGCCARDYKSYSKVTLEEKASYELNYEQMIEDFKEQHPLKPKIKTTMLGNTGPIVKDVFKYPSVVADIMYCPADLVEDLVVIFQTLDCGLPVDSQKFKAFTRDWLRRFHQSDIAWNWLSPTMHFIMHHGWEVLEFLPCGAGLLSEEGAEATNKWFRFNREHHARQSSVEFNLLDCFTR